MSPQALNTGCGAFLAIDKYAANTNSDGGIIEF
jgi:hypothetical protein